jgi:Domain of unknown function (DUF4157)
LGAPLPGGVRSKMERAFSADFSAVRVHEGAQAPGKGALAYAQGADLFFAPGRFDPHSESGQELLGHELAHVVQHAEGRAPGPQAKGAGGDATLEAEADAMGAAAARGQQVRAGAPRVVACTDEAAALQRKIDLNPPIAHDWIKIKLYVEATPINRRGQTFRDAVEEFFARGMGGGVVATAWGTLQSWYDVAGRELWALQRIDLIRNAINAVPDLPVDGYGAYDSDPRAMKGFFARQQAERQGELGTLPIIARSEQRKAQAKDLRAFADSPLFPKDVLGSAEQDDENALVSGAKGAGTAVKEALLGNAFVGHVAGKMIPSGEPRVHRDYVDTLRETPPHTFADATARTAVNVGVGMGTLGISTIGQALAGVAHRFDAADQAKEMSHDKTQPTLARHLARGQAATDRDKAIGGATALPITAFFSQVGADQVADWMGGKIGEGITGLIEAGSESVAETVLRSGNDWAGKKGSSKVTAAASQEEVKKASRSPAAPSGRYPLQDDQDQTVADMHLLHLTSLDRDFAEAMVGELSKDPLTPMELDALSTRFPDDEDFNAAIANPEAARVRLRQLLSGGGKAPPIAMSPQGKHLVHMEEIRANEGPGRKNAVSSLIDLSQPHPMQLAAPRVVRNFPETWKSTEELREEKKKREEEEKRGKGR